MTTSNAQIASLIRITSELISLLNREVELLRAMRVSDIIPLQKEKHDLSVLYEGAINVLAANPEILEALEPAVRSELSDLAARFDAVLAENTQALNTVKESHDRLLRTIVEAVEEKRSSQKAYTATGELVRPRGRRALPSAPISVDQRL